MAKRIKRVFQNADQVLHLWANQAQSDARCRNVFFEDKSVWSYGYHYELGRLHTLKNGQTIALINSRKYSVTTNKHQVSAYYAVEHLSRLYSSDVGSIETALLETQDRLMNSLFDYFSRRSFWRPATKHDLLQYSYLREVFEFNKVCDVLNRPEMKLTVDDDFIGLMIAHSKRAIAREAELQSPEMIEKRRIASEKRKAKEIPKWLLGKSTTNNIRSLYPQIIRIKGDVVQTSRGAEVPLDEALTALRMINAGVAKPGLKIGHFEYSQTTTVNEKPAVQIGCHTIDLNQAREVLTTARTLKAVAQ